MKPATTEEVAEEEEAAAVEVVVVVVVEAAEGLEVSHKCELPDVDNLARPAKALPEHPAVNSCTGGISTAHSNSSSTSIPAGCSSSSEVFCTSSFPFFFFLSKLRWYF